MAVKKTAAEQNAENTVSAEPAQSKPGVSIYVGPSILGYIQKNTIYPCAAAEAVERDDVKIATEKYPGVADFIINAHAARPSLHLHGCSPNPSKEEYILWQIMVSMSAAPIPPWRHRTPQPAASPLSLAPHRCLRRPVLLRPLASRCSAPAMMRQRNSWVMTTTGPSTPSVR